MSGFRAEKDGKLVVWREESKGGLLALGWLSLIFSLGLFGWALSRFFPGVFGCSSVLVGWRTVLDRLCLYFSYGANEEALLKESCCGCLGVLFGLRFVKAGGRGLIRNWLRGVW